MSKERKNFHFQIKAAGITLSDEGQEFGQITAYGAVFNNVDEGNDRILPGAFKRTIKNSKERAIAREKKYLVPILWQHDPNELIGGWYDLQETEFGLLGKGDISLATQRGREYYELAKAGMTDQFSIVYDIPGGGSKYDKSGVRELLEIRLFSIDVVTFAMNEETKLVGIKAMDMKASIVGNTSGPIGPRDELWDSSKAEKQIWTAAYTVAYDDETSEIDTALAKKYFMVLDGDPQKKGSYSYPFWYVGSDPHISVGAVKAIAAAIQGSRGASAPDGLKAKVETLYTRINKKYPDDPQLTPPWQDDGKARRRMQRKTLLEHYNEEMCEDLLEDWQDVYVCALTDAILDALKIGDQPESDISDALDAFKELVLSKFVAQAVECGLSDYLEENQISYSSADYTMQNGSDSPSYYGYMSRRHASLARKTGRAISASNGDKIQSNIDALHDTANKAMKAMKAHTQAVHDAADDLAAVLQGSEAAYGTDPGDAGDEQEGKRASRNTNARARREPPSQKSQTSESGDTVSDDELSQALDSIKTLSIV